MKPVAFEYCRPDSVAEAVALLAEFGPEASVLAGGMSLGPMLNMRLVRPAAVIDVTRLADLSDIRMTANTVLTGAALTQAEAWDSEPLMAALPLLAKALPHVGHFQTRNLGTLGGSIAHGDPSAEIPLALVTLDGRVVLRSAKGERRLRARDFFAGMLTTARRDDELITALEWPRAGPQEGHAFDEIAERHGDFAIAAAACRVRLDAEGRVKALDLGLGGVADRPLSLATGELLGGPLDGLSIGRFARAQSAGLEPPADQVASAEFRRELARILTERVIGAALAEAAEGG